MHIDVHVVEPTPKRPCLTLITSGMSDRPMAAASDDDRYAELLICLPPNWPLTQEAFKNDENFWPIHWLKLLARYPHEYDCWLGFGHTIPYGDPPKPFAANTGTCCMLLAPPVSTPREFWELPVNADKTIKFWALVPLFREEMAYKLKHGAGRLLSRFDEHGVNELIDLDRPNVCEDLES